MTPPPDPDSSFSPARSPLSTPAVRAPSDPSRGRRPSSPRAKGARPETRGAGGRRGAGFPRAPPWGRRARRRAQPGDPAPGHPGRPTRCAANPGEGRDRDARPGGGCGSRPRLRELHRGARRLTWVGPRLGRVRSRCRRLPRPARPRSALGVAAGPPVPLPSHAPPVVPRPSWGRAWSRREGLPLLPGAGTRHQP